MSAFPNPDVYLNHIPPAFAAQFEAARNLSLAVLGAFIWDILIYIPADAKILYRSPFHLVTCCFISSRLFALVFVVLGVITFTHPVEHCLALSYSIGVGCVLTITSTTFIFLQRLRAVYSGHRPVQVVGILLWVGTVVTMAFTVVDAQTSHIPGTKYCAYTVANRSLLANSVLFLTFDTFTFFAISYRIGFTHLDLEGTAGLKTAVTGKALPRLSRAVLRGGQYYYLILLGLQLPVLIITAIPSMSPNIKLMVTFPLGCLAASMASRIFRNMKIADAQLELQPMISDVNFSPTSRQPHSVNSAFHHETRVNPHSHLSPRPVAVTLSQASSHSGPSSDGAHDDGVKS